MSFWLMNCISHRSYTPGVAPLMSLLCGVVLVFGGGAVAAQSQIDSKPQPQATPTTPIKTRHFAILRATDSRDGSRVAVTSNQSLSDYEAYRSGDRFYVRIPAADVPAGSVIRGKAFADVKAQRNGDSTLISFRLAPGATAHVNQHANRLDILIGVAAPAPAGPPANATSATASASPIQTPPTLFTANSSRANALTRQASSLTNATPTPSEQEPAAANANVAQALPATTESAPQAGNVSSASTTNQLNNSVPTQSTTNGGVKFRERLHNWILLAQLNPIPVATAVIVLLLLIGMLLYRKKEKSASPDAKSNPTDADPISKSAGAAPAESGAFASMPIVKAEPADENHQTPAPAALKADGEALKTNEETVINSVDGETTLIPDAGRIIADSNDLNGHSNSVDGETTLILDAGRKIADATDLNGHSVIDPAYQADADREVFEL